MARRKTVPEMLAEAFLLKQQAKAAEAGVETPAKRAASKAASAPRPRKARKADPEAERAKLLAAGEKLLAREDSARADLA
ncbi:hypothetical protein ABTZ03_25960 [Kitasatospora sp. NPDC096077]|uniref:hypothetical protein n=1 Tax=Kitasatospora sp. NPDC096077 TaxID=3155544 RepID=UPI00331C6AD4